jgi:O-antigen ligase
MVQIQSGREVRASLHRGRGLSRPRYTPGLALPLATGLGAFPTLPARRVGCNMETDHQDGVTTLEERIQLPAVPSAPPVNWVRFKIQEAAKDVPEPEEATAVQRPDRVLWAIAAVLWMYVWRFHDFFPVLASLKAPLLTAVAAIGLFAIDRTRLSELKRLNAPLPKLVLALLVMIVAGLPTSLYAGKGAEFLAKDFVPALMLSVMILAGVRSYRDLEWLVITGLFGAVFYSFMILTGFDVEAGSGRLGHLVYYDANDFALLLVCSMPFAVYCLRKGMPGVLRLLGLVAIGFFSVMLIQSGSRGGFIAFVLVMLYLLLRFRSISVMSRLLAVAAGVGVLILVGNEAYWANMRSILNPKQDYNWAGKEDGGRMEIWKRGIGYMLDRPVLGVGIRAFPQAEGSLSALSKEYAQRGKGLKWSVAHNSFVEVGAETGIPGLLIFLSILGTAFVLLARVRRWRKFAIDRKMDFRLIPQAALAQALTASMLGFVTAGIFLSAEYFAFLYVLLAIVTALVMFSPQPQKAGVTKPALQPRRWGARGADQSHRPSRTWAPGEKKGDATAVGTAAVVLSKTAPPRRGWSPSGDVASE